MPNFDEQWERNIIQWAQLEQKYRSEWQIIGQIAPKTSKVYEFAKSLLDKNNAIYIENNSNGKNTIYLTGAAKKILDNARTNGIFEPIYMEYLREIRYDKIINNLDKQIQLTAVNINKQQNDPYAVAAGYGEKYINYQDKQYQNIKELLAEAARYELDLDDIKQHCEESVFRIREIYPELNHVSNIITEINDKIDIEIQEVRDDVSHIKSMPSTQSFDDWNH